MNMEERLWHWLTCGGRISTLQREEECSLNCRQRITSQVDDNMIGLLRYSLYGTRDAAQNWEEELASTLSDLKLTRGSACLCMWKGCIKGEHIVAVVHGDDITIGGERSAVAFFIKNDVTRSRKK